jgi:hypothetical protein
VPITVLQDEDRQPSASLTSAHLRFEAALPAIDRTLRYLFRRWPRGRRIEAIADGRAAAWHAWHGLLERGEDPTAVGVTGIAANAARYVKAGRRLGTGAGGRGAMDVFNLKAQAACGYRLISLDSGTDAAIEDSQRGKWREWVVEDRRVTPADEACFRLDFAAWLDGLPYRERRIAELLAEGHEGKVVARTVGVSPGRVSQLRPELGASWRAFQGVASAP